MRKIIHVDMDAFYAQVEMRDNPEYRGKPIIIGSGNHRYGVVSTCSYEARAFGVRSAMPNIQAYKLCPQGIFVRQKMEKYARVSAQIFEIFHEVSDCVEGLSLDEAYIDVTENKLGYSSAIKVAHYLKQRILEVTNLTSSAGVSYNKLLAKIGSDFQKPNGLTVITPEQTEAFISNLSLKNFPGVGTKLYNKMEILGIFKPDDLLQLSSEECIKYFGKHGNDLYNYVRGIDHRQVIAESTRKSIGQETTLKKEIENIAECKNLLYKLVNSTISQIQNKKLYATTFTIKIKYADFTQYTRAKTVNPSHTSIDFTKHIDSLLLSFPHQNKHIRLVGVSFSGLCTQSDIKKSNIEQTTLF